MLTAPTKEYLDEKFGGIDQHFEKVDEQFNGINQQFHKVDQKIDGMEARLTESIRGLNTNFNKSQGAQNEQLSKMGQRFNAVDEKLDSIAEDVTKIKLAVVDLMGTDRHMHNLVRELKIKGISLEESKIFTSSVAP